MSRCRAGRVFLVLLVATQLCVPAWAAPGRPSAEPHLFNILARFWDSLTAGWSEIAAPTTDEGCMIDPNGRCIEAAAPATDEGCAIDPNGACTPGS